jgi:hypothetical protein
MRLTQHIGSASTSHTSDQERPPTPPPDGGKGIDILTFGPLRVK